MEGLNNKSGFDFNMEKGKSSIIKVIGVGGGGNNALQHMHERGIHGVDFLVLNTDAQALDGHSVSNKVQLGASTTEGLGAGADPSVGEAAAIESIEEIKTALGSNTKMVFITAGMGGGTGTGAAPIVAKTAKDMGILTVAIVTQPFGWEGKRRTDQANAGLEKLKENVDSLIVINNDKLEEQFPDMDFDEAFFQANEVLTNAAKGMAEVITAPFRVNIDFRDAKTVLENSGTALMSIGTASGDNRAEDAVKRALDSPLLDNNNINGAKQVMLLILSGEEKKAKMSEIKFISSYIQSEAGGDNEANVIWGVGTEEGLGDSIKVLVIATGFSKQEKEEPQIINSIEKEKIVLPLEGNITNSVASTPVFTSTSNPKQSTSESSGVTSEKKVFRLEDNDEGFNTPTNTFAMAQSLVEIETPVLEEEPQTPIQIFDEEKEIASFSFQQEVESESQIIEEEKEIDLFSYTELEPVSITFNLNKPQKDEKPQAFQFEEKPAQSFDFRVNHSTEEPHIPQINNEVEEAPIFKVITKEEPKFEEEKHIVEKKTEPVFEIEQKEEFTIIERKTEENPKILERRNKLKAFNSRFQVNEVENEFELVPAFKRRNVEINLENSSEQNITSFYSEQNGEVKMKENRFLNKDVD